ncbi:hypothetical protein BTO15_07455 [Polaribacter sejongensis]|uniref:DUF3781 domain-containing protein n=1 Tax=Polaribacter sejongensis TaxID=985043 RepID=A0ABN5F3D6_9FLAO|nr:DUF3781 domain-containing protein [Polaribacter sejongensis]AUC21946.1 hypothetical protein BTO15_07455 [Polaribacter sejongensis]
MENKKSEILEKHCYTEMVYQRINKKLKIAFSKDENEQFIRKVLEETVIENYLKKGKNFYVSNKEHNIRITVNSNTFRIITVDRI